jgi:hypothetical protein
MRPAAISNQLSPANQRAVSSSPLAVVKGCVVPEAAFGMPLLGPELLRPRLLGPGLLPGGTPLSLPCPAFGVVLDGAAGCGAPFCAPKLRANAATSVGSAFALFAESTSGLNPRFRPSMAADLSKDSESAFDMPFSIVFKLPTASR